MTTQQITLVTENEACRITCKACRHVGTHARMFFSCPAATSSGVTPKSKPPAEPVVLIKADKQMRDNNRHPRRGGSPDPPVQLA